MKAFRTEIILFVIQLWMFYIFPLFAGPTDAMGMVFLIIAATFVLSLTLGTVSGKRIKHAYPLAAAVVFIPSVFIYYNASAMVHSVWYLVISAVGLTLGNFIRLLIKRK